MFFSFSGKFILGWYALIILTYNSHIFSAINAYILNVDVQGDCN